MYFNALLEEGDELREIPPEPLGRPRGPPAPKTAQRLPLPAARSLIYLLPPHTAEPPAELAEVSAGGRGEPGALSPRPGKGARRGRTGGLRVGPASRGNSNSAGQKQALKVLIYKYVCI